MSKRLVAIAAFSTPVIGVNVAHQSFDDTTADIRAALARMNVDVDCMVQLDKCSCQETLQACQDQVSKCDSDVQRLEKEKDGVARQRYMAEYVFLISSKFNVAHFHVRRCFTMHILCSLQVIHVHLLHLFSKIGLGIQCSIRFYRRLILAYARVALRTSFRNASSTRFLF